MLAVGLKEILLASEVIVENDLFLKVVPHCFADSISFIDTICDSLVSSSELFKRLYLFFEIRVIEDTLVLNRVS